MPQRKRSHYEVPYPVDAIGVPIAPEELGFQVGQEGEWNNHHLAFFRRAFGMLAISQTFRDLSIMQREMPIPEHRRLHQQYLGIHVPRLITMMDIINNERETGGTLKEFDISKPAGQKYQTRLITPGEWNYLKKEYNHHSDV